MMLFLHSRQTGILAKGINGMWRSVHSVWEGQLPNVTLANNYLCVNWHLDSEFQFHPVSS